jgi:hypothetical protein
MPAAIALQKAIRARLTTDSAMVALVPAAAILDRRTQPNTFPCVLIGQDQELPIEQGTRRCFRVHTTLHIWVKEIGTTRVKAIAGEIRRALLASPPNLEGARCHDLKFTSLRFRHHPDPAGMIAHGVITLESLVEELEP